MDGSPRMVKQPKNFKPKRWVIFALTSILPIPILATTFATKPFLEFVGEAPYIVRGKVGMTYSNYGTGSDGHKQIYTFTELMITEWIKDDSAPSLPKNRLLMRQLGGVKDGIGMKVVGVAEFSRSEDAVVFLGKKNPDETFDVFGMTMGKYNVVKNKAGDEQLVGGMFALRAHTDHDTASDTTGAHTDEADPNPKKDWKLEELREIVRNPNTKIPTTDSAAVTSPSLAPFNGQSVATAPKNSIREPAQFNQANSSTEVPSLSLGHLVGIFLMLSLLAVGIWKLVSRPAR